MTYADLLGHIAYALVITGMFLIGKKQFVGWMFKIAGDMLWLYIGLIMSMSSIWLWEIFFIAQSCFFMKEWLRDKD